MSFFISTMRLFRRTIVSALVGMVVLAVIGWLVYVLSGPEPQVWVPGFTFVHAPAVIPVHVLAVGSWQSG